MANDERASGRSLKLSIPELRHQLFEDFSLESSRTKPLTVLGEDAYGTRQGRIVTKPIPAEAEGGGGAPAEPPRICPAVTMTRRIANATRYKCGYPGFVDLPRRYYKTRDYLLEWNCAAGQPWENAGSYHYIQTWDPPYPPCDNVISGEEGSPFGADCDNCYPRFTTSETVRVTEEPEFAGSGGATVTETLSDEYTTGDLIDDTLALLELTGSYSSGAVSAYLILSIDDQQLDAQKADFKFTIAPAMAGNVQVNWTERFVPSDGSPPTETPRSVVIPAGETVSDIQILDVPTVGGTTSIIDIRISEQDAPETLLPGCICNEPRTANQECMLEDFPGDAVEVTIPKGVFCGTSQEAVDAAALAEAETRALARLNCCGRPPGGPTNIAVTYNISGEVGSDEYCGEVNVDLSGSGSASAPTACVAPNPDYESGWSEDGWAAGVAGQTAPINPCPPVNEICGECYNHDQTAEFAVDVRWNPIDGWSLYVASSMGGGICGNDPTVGDEYSVPIGSGTGTFTISSADPNSPLVNHQWIVTLS